MPASGPSPISAASSTASAATASITSLTAALWLVCDGGRSRCERKGARSSMAASLSPLPGVFLKRAAVWRASLRERNLSNKGHFVIFGPGKVFIIKGHGNGRPFLAGIDDPPIARTGRGSEKQIDHRRSQAALSDAA